ncbi:TPA: type II toxin-antitoxin system HicB family antitoxin [Candidatus Uhrbacteria bacterium]|nr:type II toxin-antitoxin system HicB family antitoxin [Candidatus Uhrbacteria bacterium]
MKALQKTPLVRHQLADYPVIVQEEAAGGYWVSCPAFEGCYSQGKTIDQALANIQEAIELCVADAPKARRQWVPNVSLHTVRV